MTTIKYPHKTCLTEKFNPEILEMNTVRNKKINYLKNDKHIGNHIKEGKYWEEWMFKHIESNYKQHTNMVDLGGNIGTTTLLMSEVLSENCKIFTFEPIFDDILLKNVIDNNLTNKIEVYPYGLSNVESVTKVNPPPYNVQWNFGGFRLYENPNTHKEILEIPLVPLDNFNLENISLIKIDVENMEIQVLEGCINMLKRCKPTILIECFHLNQLKQSEVFKELEKIGYKIKNIPEGYFDFIMQIE